MKTKLDLYTIASATALATLEETNPAQLRIASATAAQQNGVAPADFNDWENYFTNARRTMLQLRAQPLASLGAAGKAGAKSSPAPAVTQTSE